jgi:hypothetical protein
MNFLIRRSFILFYLLFIIIMTNSMGMAQDVKKVGTSAAAFLRIPVGSRGTAMGSAFVSIADDASAMFWNPAGIASMSGYSLLIDHSPWLPGIDFNYFGIVLPFPIFGNIGINTTVMTTEEMLVTTPDQPMGTGERFSAASIAVGITYSRNLTHRFSVGGNFKYINETIFHCSASGFAFDIGTLYTTPFYGIRLGTSISNVGTKMRIDGEDLNIRADIAPDQKGNNQSIVGRLKTDEFNLPLIMRVGLSKEILQTSEYRLTIAVDGVNPNDNAQSVNIGAECALFHEMLTLQGGYNDLFLEDREKGLTLGMGLNIEIQHKIGLVCGYAFQDFIHLGDVNRFSLVIHF